MKQFLILKLDYKGINAEPKNMKIWIYNNVLTLGAIYLEDFHRIFTWYMVMTARVFLRTFLWVNTLCKMNENKKWERKEETKIQT